ncbi:hypothetical protein [Aquibacillus kalidii]|uniref:hypothetical protein n=1 Tax=Aquibacillus kalidii TaxID=2762597 RepID=UPI0016459CE4|nr:hypothetical protein [Aquibacillus kalidii]
MLDVVQYDWKGNVTEQFIVSKDNLEGRVIQQSLIVSIKVKQVFASLIVLTFALILTGVEVIVSKKLSISVNPLKFRKIRLRLFYLTVVVFMVMILIISLEYRDLILEGRVLLDLLGESKKK